MRKQYAPLINALQVTLPCASPMEPSPASITPNPALLLHFIRLNAYVLTRRAFIIILMFRLRIRCIQAWGRRNRCWFWRCGWAVETAGAAAVTSHYCCLVQLYDQNLSPYVDIERAFYDSVVVKPIPEAAAYPERMLKVCYGPLEWASLGKPSRWQTRGSSHKSKRLFQSASRIWQIGPCHCFVLVAVQSVRSRLNLQLQEGIQTTGFYTV